MSSYYICDTCARFIECEPGDFAIQDAEFCPRRADEKKAIYDYQRIGEVCGRYVRKVDYD